MRKRIFSVILALCMVLGLLPMTAWATTSSPVQSVKIGTAEMNSTTKKYYHNGDEYGAQGYANDNPTGANATFENGTLTLNNLNVADGKIWWGYNDSGAHDLTIILADGTTNNITNTSSSPAIHGEFGGEDGGPSLTIKSNGTATLNAIGGGSGIWVWQNITIQGKAIVHATGNTSLGIGNNMTSGTITITDNAKVYATGKTYGIGYSNDRVNTPVISGNAVVVAKGEDGAFMNAPDLGGYTGSSDKKLASTAYETGTFEAYNESKISNYKHVIFGGGAPASATYTVSFHNGGGKGTMDAVTGVSGTYTLPANGFTPPNGKQFKAWNVGGEEKAVGATVTITGNTTVTAVWKDIPSDAFQIIPSTASMRGKGTVTLQVVNIPDAATVNVTCDELSIDLTDNHDNTWSAYLPNRTQTYTFTATAGGQTATCTVDVRKKSSSSSDSSSGGSSNEKPEEKPVEKPQEKPEEVPKDNEIVLTIGEKVTVVFGDSVVNDVAPVVRNDRAMLPIRFVVEALGGTVTWDQAQQSVTCVKGDNTVIIYIGHPFALVNGNPVELDSPAFIENGRTYLPIRFVAENLDAAVTWDADTKEVTVVPNK